MRPIFWAVGSLVLMAVAAGTALQRHSAAGPAGASVAAASGAERLLVISMDLRGHYSVHPQVNGAVVRMMVDTGATSVALTEADASAAGIRVRPGDFTSRVGTANGIVAVAPVRLGEIRLGDIVVRDVEAVVVPAGRLGTSLLGMSFLRRLKGFEVSGGRLTLRG